MTSSPYFSPEHDALRDQLRRFVDNEMRPKGDAWEAAGESPRSLLKSLGDLGMLGIRYPEAYGGSELDQLSTIVLTEEISRSTYGGANIMVLVHTDMASPHLANAGNKAQMEKYMPGIISGDILTAVAVTEPDAGSDVAGLKTRARQDGDDWVLNGAKMFITNGVNADLYFVAARTDPDAKGSRGITMFIVEKGTPGFSCSRKLEKFGWHSSDTAELVFEDVRLPKEAVLGEVNRGFYAVMQNFQNERLVIAAASMAESQTALDLTLDYVKNRKAFGGVLWDKQAIRQRLSQRQAEVLAGRQLVHHAGWMAAQGLDCVKEVSMCKAYCGELINRVMYDCQQFHGGAGYLKGTAIERMTRDARIHSIGGGATEVMLEEVAKRL
ncbi:acyl-CoA dehydrogenase family protein [Rhodovibrionaceae bacterium A322]